MASLSINQQVGYAAPASVEEAISLINQDPLTQVLAGGHSLLAAIKQDKIRPSLLVDISRISGLEAIEWSQNDTAVSLKVGAMASYAQIAEDNQIQAIYPALAAAAAAIGDVQIRNWGRIGDVFAYRYLAGDLLAAALALEAVFVVQTSAGSQRQAAAALVSDLSISDLSAPNSADSAERFLITGIEFPSPQLSTSAYTFFKHAASGHTLCGAAVALETSHSGTVEHCRIALSGSAVPAMRLSALETSLVGSLLTTEVLSAMTMQVNDLVLAMLESNDGSEGAIAFDIAFESVSADYVAYLSGVMVTRALETALRATSA
ncbi:MAG: FAD binding domain-containing protein [Cyanobacteria bacterium J06560_2]